MSISIGIDLGTTNSVLAFANTKPNGDIISKVVDIQRPVSIFSGVGGKTRLSREKKATLPSCIYYIEEKNYTPIVGDFAKMQYPVRPHLVAKSIKSQMGNPYAQDLSLDVPDKTPAQISAQILKHMIREAEISLRTKIDDVIITVPANFDSSMCKATRDAAEIAGIKVRNSDGSEKPILLSEPNAVIYDLFNQIRNGEIPSTILDLETNKIVLVFDIGGGTLDITMHEIKKRNGSSDGTLKVDEIATNRYTLLGGDDFDRIIAEKMFERYLEDYEKKSKDAIVTIKQKKKEVMSQLVDYAEMLKIELNESVRTDDSIDSDNGWFDDEDDEKGFDVGGNIHSTGYSYDDRFTQDDIEKILSIFMADNLSFDDYKRIESITNTRNIIFPILDVLDKASKKLNTDNVVVDAVILNGGMSKFYMIKKRLTEFFGFEPIESLDPDQSVARGAAVYHYLLSHSNENLTDDMKIIEDVPSQQNDITDTSTPAVVAFQKTNSHIGIEWGKSILNDSLYLGMRNGAVEEIIPTGAELPYSSQVKKGFRIQPGQNMISFPIKSRNIDGSYRTIAKSTIGFSNNSKYPRLIAFKIDMNINKVITMSAWTYSEGDEQSKHDIGSVTISIDNNSSSNNKKGPGKVLPPVGSKLDAKAEINSLIKMCNNFEKATYNKQNLASKLKNAVSTICSSSNCVDFAPVIIRSLRECNCNEARTRLFIIARRIMKNWTEADKRSVALQCMSQIGGALNGFLVYGSQKNVNIQAIYTLAFCGNAEQFKQLEKLHSCSDYYQACLYAHAVSKTSVEWLADKLCRDINAVENRSANYLQFTAYSVGLALSFSENSEIAIPKKQTVKIIKNLTQLVSSGKLTLEQVANCILALGWICDCRNIEVWSIDYGIIQNLVNVLEKVEYIYEYTIVKKCEKVISIAKKLIDGQELSDDDERFLLEKITI